jgi:hypothetical protein
LVHSLLEYLGSYWKLAQSRGQIIIILARDQVSQNFREAG